MIRWESARGIRGIVAGLACLLLAQAAAADLWDVAQQHRDTHRFSTLITAQQVRDYLGTEEGRRDAIDWCKATAVTKVYVESFRDGYQAERDTLLAAKNAFEAAGIEVSGCVTPTGVGKRSTGWEPISCYTDPPTQDRVREIFAFIAPLFDEIMIDDFWFTDCECEACDAARKARTATIADKQYPVEGDTWEDYRCELMVRISQDLVLDVAHEVNPDCTLIIKYPQWYEQFHERGYEVIRQTDDFERTWVGTETRDYDDPRWGGCVQYRAYFLMRWLGEIGGEKCGGGWYDALGTTEGTYVEQARQTILAGARESMLFCYGLLLREQGAKDVVALRGAIPELFQVAEEVAKRKIVGVAAYRPANAHPENESYVYDYVGMMGLPLVPCYVFPEDAPAAFFPVHALKDPDFLPKLKTFVAAGKTVLITDGLAARIKDDIDLDAPNLQVLEVNGNPKSLLETKQPALDALRKSLLAATGHNFTAPMQAGLYLFTDGSWVVENFNDAAITVTLDGNDMEIPGRGWKLDWK